MKLGIGLLAFLVLGTCLVVTLIMGLIVWFITHFIAAAALTFLAFFLAKMIVARWKKSYLHPLLVLQLLLLGYLVFAWHFYLQPTRAGIIIGIISGIVYLVHPLFKKK